MYLFYACDPDEVYSLYTTGIICGDDGYIHLQESVHEACQYGRVARLSSLKLMFRVAVIRVSIDEASTEADMLPVELGKKFKLSLPPGYRIAYDIPVSHMMPLNQLHSLVK